MVIWIVFTAVDSDVYIDPHPTPHQRVSAASMHTTVGPHAMADFVCPFCTPARSILVGLAPTSKVRVPLSPPVKSSAYANSTCARGPRHPMRLSARLELLRGGVADRGHRLEHAVLADQQVKERRSDVHED